MRNWKRGERQFGELLGCERIPVTGRRRGRTFADLIGSWLSVEVKTRKALPVYLADAIDSAERGAAYASGRDGAQRLPVVILHADHQSYGNSLVVMRLKDADEWFGFSSRGRDE